MSDHDAPPALRIDREARIPATWTLIALVIAVHLATGALAWRDGTGWFEAFLGSRGVRVRIDVGGQYRPLVDAGESWRLWTSVLLHGDALHLFVNALALGALGRLLEPLVGSVRFAAWFAAGGLAGSLVSHAAEVVQSDGASGGAFALLGGALAIGWRNRARFSADDAWLLGPVLTVFTVLNVVLSFALPFVDPAGHLGGLALGLLWGSAARPDGRSRPGDTLVVSVFALGCGLGWWRCFA